MKFAKVAPNEVSSVWLQCAPHIHRALITGRGEAEVEHLRRHVVDGRMDMFVGIDDDDKVAICLLSQFIRHANYTAFRICCLGGDPHSLEVGIEEFMPTLKEWTRANGASKWEAYCHQGMARLLQKKLGFGERYSVVVLDL